MGDGSADRFMNLGAVIDKVGQAQVYAVVTLVGPPPAETHVALTHSGTAKEVMGNQPTLGMRLYPRATFGNEPDLTAEERD